MLAETVADTDGQTLGILKYKIQRVRNKGVITFLHVTLLSADKLSKFFQQQYRD